MHVGDQFDRLYHQSHTHADLDKAIMACNTAIRITPVGHPYQADRHSQLGEMLFHRIEYSNNMAKMASSATLCSLKMASTI
jgi:hypothetical protein